MQLALVSMVQIQSAGHGWSARKSIEIADVVCSVLLEEFNRTGYLLVKRDSSVPT